MLINLGVYELNIDVERTAAFYAKAPGISCDCEGCQNYAQAVALLPSSVLSLFRQFGIDPEKPAEVYVYHAPDKHTLLYGGFYHICGTILNSESPAVQVKGIHRLNEQFIIRLCDDCSVYFKSDIDLLEEGFPEPIIQMEIIFELPWVLKEQNPYEL